jgi:pimeloyl-ACP methyl ester carboxylesterase
MGDVLPLDASVLPSGVRARFLDGINGLRVHVLEAGFESAGRPCVLLLHGFPELAYSWRKVMPALAAAGFHAVAPDQRGYGRTTGWDADYDGDLASFRLLNLVRDTLTLVAALGYRTVDVVGHDFGAAVAAGCALIRPDVFRSMVLMSAPFAGAPVWPSGSEQKTSDDIHAAMARLPRPRKHYQWYYSTRAANADMWRCPQGVHAFLRAYFHFKSADWPGNKPFRLSSWSAEELTKMPTYYIMDLDQDMATTVAPEMPSPGEIAACRWLTEDELSVYSREYERNGFQGGLQWYRCGTSDRFTAELETWSGRSIDVPSCFISGRPDWGTYQRPGVFEAMQKSACTKMLGCHLVDGAGHWVQQEQPAEVSRLLLDFLAKTS